MNDWGKLVGPFLSENPEYDQPGVTHWIGDDGERRFREDLAIEWHFWLVLRGEVSFESALNVNIVLQRRMREAGKCQTA